MDGKNARYICCGSHESRTDNIMAASNVTAFQYALSVDNNGTEEMKAAKCEIPQNRRRCITPTMVCRKFP